MSYRLYRSLVLGDGSRQSPYRPKIARYILDETSDQTFWNWTNAGFKPHQYVLVKAPEALLDLIDADPDIKPISPRKADLQAIQAWLDDDIGQVSNTDGMEEDGCSVAWTTAGTKVRQLLQYLLKWHHLCGDVIRLRDADAQEFLLNHLDTRVGQVPVRQRQKIRTWIEGKGIDTVWMNNQTTVRQVLQAVLKGIDWPADGIGPLRF